MTSNPKILCNAEPFGFGPAAAIAQLAKLLRSHVGGLNYIGEAHTLELQQHIGYDSIFDSKIVNSEEIIRDHDIFITAMDFEMARKAKEAGCKVVVYDALAWYWSKLPTVLKDVDLYIVQDFIGVQERLLKEADNLPQTLIIPPIVTRVDENAVNTSSSEIFINFGGISNPYWDKSVGEMYVNTLINIFKDRSEQIVLSGSSRYAQHMSELPCNWHYKTLTPEETLSQFSHAQVACFTPGLGNIYEAAQAGNPVLLLPPVNDSQGQQMQLLKRHGYCNNLVDWHDFLPIRPIDYFSNQQDVLMRIRDAIAMLSSDLKAQSVLQKKVDNLLSLAFNDPTNTRLVKLTEDFGSGGFHNAIQTIIRLDQSSGKTPGIYAVVKKEDRNVLRLHDYKILSDWKLTLASPNGVKGTLLLQDEFGAAVTATYSRSLNRTVKQSSDTTLELLRRAGYTHFAHTTRPENMASILSLGKLLPGCTLKKVLYGDPLGPHNYIIGQLVTFDGSPHSVADLLRVTGQRSPVLLFPLEKIFETDFHINKGYPFGHYVTFHTSDGRFFPSFRVDNEVSITELLKETTFGRFHEVVINGTELSLMSLDMVVSSEEFKDTISLYPYLEKKKVIWSEPLAKPPLLLNYKPYSRNSYDIVTNALRQFTLSPREIKQLLLREFPDLAAEITSDSSKVSEILNQVNT